MGVPDQDTNYFMERWNKVSVLCYVLSGTFCLAIEERTRNEKIDSEELKRSETNSEADV